MLTSHIPGRIRIRHQDLIRPEVSDSISETLMALDGVDSVSINENIGSLLIHYDEQQISMQELLNAVQTIPHLKPRQLSGSSRSTSTRWTRHQTAKRGMLAGLGLALAMAVLDEEDLHVLFGLGFLGFLALHLNINHKRIFK